VSRKSKSKVPIVIVTKFTTTVMVMGLISNKADVMPTHRADCNPLAYHLWSVCERDVNTSPHNTAASLMAKIMEVMGNLPNDTLEKDCQRFCSRIEAVVEAGGNFIK